MTRWVTNCQSPCIYKICYCVREWRLSDRQMTLTLVLVLQLKLSNGVWTTISTTFWLLRKEVGWMRRRPLRNRLSFSELLLLKSLTISIVDTNTMFHQLLLLNLRTFLIERLNLLEQQNLLLTAQCIFDFLGEETPQSRSVRQRSLCNEGYTSRIPLFKSKYKTKNLASIKIFLQNIRHLPSTFK